MKIKIPIADLPLGTDRHLVRFRVMDESGNSSYWVYFTMTYVGGEWVIDKNTTTRIQPPFVVLHQPQGMV